MRVQLWLQAGLKVRLQGALLSLALVAPGAWAAGDCRVLDPELQGVYAGPCENGLAQGYGIAQGVAEYQGEFSAGRKHGKGVKTWASGDRYAGTWVEDRREGAGVYSFGRGPWAGERYEGSFLNDRRHGFGTYRWSTGDVYSGPWKDDVATGPPTPMMIARAQFAREARSAVARQGQKVCREVPVGIAGSDWLRGVVVEVAPDKVGVRIDDAGKQLHILANVEARKGVVLWDSPEAWLPCW